MGRMTRLFSAFCRSSSQRTLYAGMAVPHAPWYICDMPTASYLDRMLEPVVESFTPAVARKIVNLRADPELERHIGELRRKANEGTLSAAENAEYKDFVESVDVISILQAKARRFLTRRSG